MPGTTAETSHFDWLISITAMIVLSLLEDHEGSARVKGTEWLVFSNGEP